MKRAITLTEVITGNGPPIEIEYHCVEGQEVGTLTIREVNPRNTYRTPADAVMSPQYIKFNCKLQHLNAMINILQEAAKLKENEKMESLL